MLLRRAPQTVQGKGGSNLSWVLSASASERASVANNRNKLSCYLDRSQILETGAALAMFSVPAGVTLRPGQGA